MTAQQVPAAENPATTRVVIAVGVRFYREGLAVALSRRRGIDVVGTAADVAELIEQLEGTRPDVVLLDLPVEDRVRALSAILSSHAGLGVVALELDDSGDDALSLVEAGVASVVDRECSIADIVSSVSATREGRPVVSPRLAAMLVERVRRVAAEAQDGALTEREKEVAELIEKGLSNKEIARRLSIEVPTVKNHVHSILRKLRVSRRGEAAAELRRQA